MIDKLMEIFKNIFKAENLLIGSATIFVAFFIITELDILDSKHILLFPVYLFFCFVLGAIVNYIYKVYIKKS